MNEQELSVLRGCRDVLREAAKMLRLRGCPGHARLSDRHANRADNAISNHFRQLQAEHLADLDVSKPGPHHRSEADPFEPQ